MPLSNSDEPLNSSTGAHLLDQVDMSIVTENTQGDCHRSTRPRRAKANYGRVYQAPDSEQLSNPQDADQAGLMKLLGILENDSATDDEAALGYHLLVKLLFTSRVFSAAERSLMNEKFSLLSNEYLKCTTGTRLLRIVALQKICFSRWSTGSSLGTLRCN